MSKWKNYTDHRIEVTQVARGRFIVKLEAASTLDPAKAPALGSVAASYPVAVGETHACNDLQEVFKLADDFFP